MLTKKSEGTLHEHSDFKVAWNTYMIIRYLTMDNELFNLGIWLDLNAKGMTPERQYKYLYAAIPKRRNGFIRYIAKKKK